MLLDPEHVKYKIQLLLCQTPVKKESFFPSPVPLFKVRETRMGVLEKMPQTLPRASPNRGGYCPLGMTGWEERKGNVKGKAEVLCFVLFFQSMSTGIA